jgi:hypothetical protein
MTQSQYVIRRKLDILELGETLGNISDACRKLGVSRLHLLNEKSFSYSFTTSEIAVVKGGWTGT